MKDIVLWNLLEDRTPATTPEGSEELRALLEELALAPLDERWPFFGRLDKPLEHAVPSVRAAATRALAGCGGYTGIKQIVRLLADEDTAVRQAAVEALAWSAASDPARWAHALFHPRVDVRLAALSFRSGNELPWFAIHLLADEACRHAVKLESVRSVPASNIFTIFDFERGKRIDTETARSFVAQMHADGVYGILSRSGPSRDNAVATSLAANAQLRPSVAIAALQAAPADTLDELFELFWDPSRPATRFVADERTPGVLFFERMTSWIIDRTRKTQQLRVYCTLLVVAARRGAWDPLAAGLALLIEPAFLRLKWVEPAVQSGAAVALYRYHHRLDPLPDDQLGSLLRLPLCTRPDGTLDLWFIGGLLRWSGATPYTLAAATLGEGAIAAAFQADPAGSAPMFSIAKDPEGRKRLLDAIATRGHYTLGTILGGLVLVSAADQLEFLDNLDGRAALRVYESLLRLTAPGTGASLSENKVRSVAEILLAKFSPELLADAIFTTVEAAGAERNPLALRVISSIASTVGSEQFLKIARKLTPARLVRLLEIIPGCAGFPYGVERVLAETLANHTDATVRKWCAGRIAHPGSSPPVSKSAGVYAVPPEMLESIKICATASLGKVLEPCLSKPSAGLTDALAARNPPGMHSIAACAALLGCHDAPDAVAREFARFSADDSDFLSKLESEVVKRWTWNQNLPLLGNCWLHLWDPHCLAGGAVLEAFEPDGFTAALRWVLTLPSIVLCRQVFETVARLFAKWRWTDKPRLANAGLADLCPLLVEQLGGEFGLPAGKTLATLYASGIGAEVLAQLREAVIAKMPELPDDVRAELRSWIDARGLASAPPQRISIAPDPSVLSRIARSRDLDLLIRICRGNSDQEVQEATLRLIEIGPAGIDRLTAILTGDDLPPLADVIAGSIPLWPDGEAIDLLRESFLRSRGAGEFLFSIGIGLLERREPRIAPALLALCRRESDVLWFRPAHWDRLVRSGVPAADLATGLAESPHPHAYRPAVEALLWMMRNPGQADLSKIIDALVAFLNCGTGRLHALRMKAAVALHARGNGAGLLLLLQEAFRMGNEQDDAARADLLAKVPPATCADAVRAVLAAGPQVVDEFRLVEMLEHADLDSRVREESFASLLRDSTLDRMRSYVVALMRIATSRERKLQRLAKTFAWGVVTGRELTGRIFAIQMNAGEGLGYTRFESEKVWITPLPILRGQQHAEAVTRGLIVHEFGHHMYHREPESLAVWKEASDNGYHGLLNLVSDEHLERRLRALDDRFGDDLKKLGAFAFQHSDREVPLDSLLEALQGRAAEVLTSTPLGVARKRGRVGVNNGGLMLEMERAGMSFSRFVRALRMGLGNRHADPKVAAGLDLFKGSQFRQKSMAELKDVSLKLRDLFGWEAVLIESFAQDALMSPDAGELIAEGEGITSDELSEAVRRLLEGQRRRGAGASKDGSPIVLVNRGPEESFSPITVVKPVPFDPVKHAAYVAQVAAPARQMRRYLQQLGLSHEPERFRVQGKRVDRARLASAGILRGDPRLLIARRTLIKPDLFLGLIIDCSGSMKSGNRIEQAKLFGTLLAEAAKGVRGIDVRIFGFTDSIIFDAGDASRCAAHSLESSGGNNDAAGLWHAALAARASRRRAKLLVMISDGAPTECSVSALRSLVARLTNKMGMCCAQVAVCPLTDRCFPHYIELEEQNVPVSVRRFGSIITTLVQKAIRGR